MTDRGILFSAPMVRALLAGRKTQTRRLAHSPLRAAKAGDRLYVREAWRTMQMHDDRSPAILGSLWSASVYGRADACPMLYNADSAKRGEWAAQSRDGWKPGRRRQAMHMPRWGSRMTLIVTDARIEPLQAISEKDAIAEGLTWDPELEAWNATGEPNWPRRTDPRASYAGLWNSLHKGDVAWASQPNVLVLTFTVERRNIDHAR
jgi:hypothetical protein